MKSLDQKQTKVRADSLPITFVQLVITSNKLIVLPDSDLFCYRVFIDLNKNKIYINKV